MQGTQPRLHAWGYSSRPNHILWPGPQVPPPRDQDSIQEFTIQVHHLPCTCESLGLFSSWYGLEQTDILRIKSSFWTRSSYPCNCRHGTSFSEIVLLLMSTKVKFTGTCAEFCSCKLINHCRWPELIRIFKQATRPRALHLCSFLGPIPASAAIVSKRFSRNAVSAKMLR